MNEQVDRMPPEQEPIQNAVVSMTLLQEDSRLYASCNIHPIASQPIANIAPLALALLVNGLYGRVVESMPEQIRNDYIEEYQKHLQNIQNIPTRIKETSTKEEKPKLELIPIDTTTPQTSGNGWEYPIPTLEIY